MSAADQSTHIQLHSPYTTPLDSRLQNFRINVERGAASLLAYLSSVEVRGDTKLSLGIGVMVGVAIVAAIAAYPGKPIDYTGAGEFLLGVSFVASPRLLSPRSSL